jgi:hypothetical protein
VTRARFLLAGVNTVGAAFHGWAVLFPHGLGPAVHGALAVACSLCVWVCLRNQEES